MPEQVSAVGLLSASERGRNGSKLVQSAASAGRASPSGLAFAGWRSDEPFLEGAQVGLAGGENVRRQDRIDRDDVALLERGRDVLVLDEGAFLHAGERR